MKRFIQTVILMATSALAGTATAQVNAEQVLAIGRNVLGMEDYMLSIQYFNQAIKAKPYMSDPYFFRALAKLNLEDYKGAEADCSLAIERNKFKTEAYKLRGFARQSMGLDSLAIEDYNLGLKYYPLDKYFLYYKGVAQTQTKAYAGSDSTFSVLLRAYPAFEEGYAARGRMNLLRGDTVAALSDIDKSLELSPVLFNSYLLRADISAARKQWDNALSDMDEAIKLRPQEADLYVNRAYLRYNKDDFFGSMSDYNYALQLQPENTAALFNRALLRYEVKDLDRAAADFTEVLRLDPANFHARFNRGLVYLDNGNPRKAIPDFDAIAARYPKFYPAYYARAEALRDLGDMRGAMTSAHIADELVRKYVKDPDRNPLDKPAIAQGVSNNGGEYEADESETEVMERFNRLVTVSSASETPLAYNDKIKGQVQDRDMRVETEPLYRLSFTQPESELKLLSNYFRELDNLNTQRYIDRNIYLTAGDACSEDEIRQLFSLAERFSAVIDAGKGRPVDRLARGVAYTSLKNYDAAILDFDAALGELPRFSVALMGRAYARYAKATSHSGDNTDNLLASQERNKGLAEAIADYDAALALDPRLVYAWFNKGDIFYLLGDYTSAIQCFTEAISTDPSLGQAYYNRGLSYLRTGNKQAAFADLSKAGELGVLPSYNLLKRMK